MASESAELPVTPEVTTSPPVVEKRRCSIGKAGSGKSNEKIVPRYLRASTGSCHDICKYGGNHSFDPKERRSIPNRATRKQLYQTRGESIGGMIAKSKLSVDSKLTKMSADVLEESADSKPTKMSMVVLKEAVYSKARTSDALDAKNRKKTSSVEVKPSLVSKSHTSPSTSQEISSSTDKEMESQSKSASRKVETPSKSTSKTVKTPSKSTSKVDSISKRISEFKVPSKSTVVPVEAVPKSILKKVENPSNSTSKVKTSSKSTSKTEGTSSHLPSSNGKLLAKPSTSLSSIRVARNNVSSSMKSLEGFGDKGSNEIKTKKKVASFKASPRKLIVPIKALSSPRASKKHQNLKIVSPLKNQKAVKKVELEEHNNLRNQKTLKKVELEENKIHEAKEKTLYVIEMETENKTLQSNQKVISYDDESYLPQLLTPESSSTSVTQSLSEENHEESEYTTSEYEVDTLSGNSEIESIVNNETLMAEKIGKQRKVKEEEDKDCEMTKLKFRRGKMVDDQSERNTPRKLKFRRAKTLVEKANVKEKVVLRHQSFEDKKDAQGLFNNVIEETASKLVEARKSKVKALVGAFETVISLQEK
ncbi:unnamed protein product [Vicia faba]|uniref:Calmodulin-binding domain-containing protein n=1 Tax=Vicia faba TaxID=3906 RepID=A0AAV0Z9X6_VICFA|nr:unnamed protein product [Vicia faba]